MKVYVSDTSFFQLQSAKEGISIGTAVYNHLCRTNPEVYSWRDQRQNEVDILVMEGESPMPIEVKYQQKIKEKDLKGP